MKPEAAEQEAADRRLRVLSITRVLPVAGNASQGIFVHRRLVAMRQRMDVRCFQPIPYFPIIRPLPQICAGQPDEPIRTPMFYLPGILKGLDARFLRRSVRAAVESAIADRRVDVMEAHFGYPDGAAVVDLAREFGIPSVVTLRGVENELMRKRGVQGQLTDALRRADGVICVSHYLEELALKAGVDPARLTVIHNAVDRRNFSPGCRADTRRRLGLPNDAKIIVSIGHLIERKGHHVLIEAMRTLRAQHSEVQLLIIGAESDRSYSKRLHRDIVKLGLGSSVHILGNVDPLYIPNYLRAADIFALMTSREGCCNAILEALACGLPTVTTDAGDNAHFISQRNGRIVARDSSECAAALSEVLSSRQFNPAEVSETLRVHGWEEVASQVEQFFRATILRRNS
ncbi:MAG: glycosyltransferase [Roseibium album]|uniref:glycosyltransferase n=1 Tax=Roseibium album TaxID=311410 RepID=UPI0032EC16BD